jgi:hypothetical protein
LIDVERRYLRTFSTWEIDHVCDFFAKVIIKPPFSHH